jgi:hypothetical protein
MSAREAHLIEPLGTKEHMLRNGIGITPANYTDKSSIVVNHVDGEIPWRVSGFSYEWDSESTWMGKSDRWWNNGVTRMVIRTR